MTFPTAAARRPGFWASFPTVWAAAAGRVWSAQLAHVLVQAVVQDPQAEHLRAASRAKAAALARPFPVCLPALTGSTRPLFGTAAGFLATAARRPRLLALPFASRPPGLAPGFAHAFTHRLAHAFALLGRGFTVSLAQSFEALAQLGAGGWAFAPHRALLLCSDERSEQTQHEHQAFHSSASGAVSRRLQRARPCAAHSAADRAALGDRLSTNPGPATGPRVGIG